MAFNAFSMLCNLHHYQVPEHSHYPKRRAYTRRQSVPTTPTNQALDTTHLLSACDGKFYASIWLSLGMPRELVEHYFCMCPAVCFQMRSASSQWMSKNLPSPMQVGSIQSTEDPDRKKGQCSLSLSLSLNWDIHLLCPCTLDLLVLGPLNSMT